MRNKLIFPLVILFAVILICGLYKVARWMGNHNQNAPAPVIGGGKPALNPQPQTPAEAEALYLLPGNPSGATVSLNNADNFLMLKPEYALAYNRSRGTANWVAWHVTKTDMAQQERADDFRPDNQLPAGWTRATPTDYARSGYDRGHLCPSADRTYSPTANSATFLMTNIVPQTGDNNRGPWKSLEEYCRSLVAQGNDLFIVAGVSGEAGRLRGKVSVPTSTWKVVLVVPQGTSDVAQITPQTRVIAVNIPNVTGIKDASWRDYRLSVRTLENATGYNFLSNVNQQIQDAIETRLDQK